MSFKIGLMIDNGKIINFYRKSQYSKWLYLNDDYNRFLELQKTAPKNVAVENLKGEFGTYYNRIKEPLLMEFNILEKAVNKDIWWSGQISSHTSTGTKLIQNVVYAYYVKEITCKKMDSNILIICPDSGLLRCIAKTCKQLSIKYTIINFSVLNKLKEYSIYILKMKKNIIIFYLDFFRLKRFIKHLHFNIDSLKGKKIVIFRSWITEGTFKEGEKYFDRNFGTLPLVLKEKGDDVVIIPMLFNIRQPLKSLINKMAKQNIPFLFPQQILNFSSCFYLLWIEFLRSVLNFKRISVLKTDVSDIFKNENLKTCFDLGLLTLNLVHPLLKKMQQKKIEIIKIFYPFENNAAEKLFILSKQKYFPNAILVGFQHTILISGQFGLELYKDDSKHIPLPDRMVCSGVECVKIFDKLNFPSSILSNGPCLRFGHIRKYVCNKRSSNYGSQLKVAMALPFNQNLAYEEIHKVSIALADINHVIFLKVHPLLDFNKLEDFVNKVQFKSYEYKEFPCDKLFNSSDIAFEIGTSVTQLEAVACGIPLIRLVPDNTFHFDPMFWMDYPIKPSRTTQEIQKNLKIALNLKEEELLVFSNKVKYDYFNEVTDATISNFYN